MKIIIVRHGDPDYTIDSLTERGWNEAELLAERMVGMNIKDFYVSPLGRAKDTLSCTLKKVNKEAVVCDWLQEFNYFIVRPDAGRPIWPWDWLPEHWTVDERMYDIDKWFEVEVFKNSDVKKEYDNVAENLDRLLKKYGYERCGRMYRVNNANEDAIALFCHGGLECVLLSHLLNIPPMLLWHGVCASPTSVTILNSEERREGKAYFRMSAFGDTSHLYKAGLEANPHARFCEIFNSDGRHD